MRYRWWIGSLLLLSRVTGGAIAARVTLGFGWLLLLAAIAASFTAQSRVAAVTDAGDDDPRSIGAGGAGAFALWLMMCGLMLVGLAALLS